MSSQELTREQQAQYLRAMGIQAWVRRDQTSSVIADTVETEIVAGDSHEVDGVKENSAKDTMDQIPLAQEIKFQKEEPPQPAIQDERPGVVVGNMDWPSLQAAVSSCTACVLHESRINTVFGVGDQNAQVMVIGEAPGVDEDQQGEPFVGRAGQLLNNMLLAIGYKREQVYIANILKCRPPDNRDPRPEEIAACESFLKRQVALVKPKVILAVGRIAAHNLLKVETPIGRMRGKVYQYDDTPVIVTFHPAYLLRKPSEKARSWDDLRLTLTIIDENY